MIGSTLNYLKGGGRFEHPEALPLDVFESNYKRTASEGDHECSISTILRKKVTVNSLSMSKLIVTNYFITLTKAICNKAVISLGSAGSAVYSSID